MKEELLKIVKHYGVLNQLKYIQTEYFELDEAILDKEYKESNCGTPYIRHIAEELADVLVMLKQIQYYYDIKDEDVKEIMKGKIERQLERIKNEQEQF